MGWIDLVLLIIFLNVVYFLYKVFVYMWDEVGGSSTYNRIICTEQFRRVEKRTIDAFKRKHPDLMSEYYCAAPKIFEYYDPTKPTHDAEAIADKLAARR